MKIQASLIISLMLITATLAHSQEGGKAKAIISNNPLLKPWTGPYGGVPDFGAVKLDLLKEALTDGMQISLQHYDDIASSKSAPTFENTILPMEKASEELNRATVLYSLWGGNLSSPEFRKVQEEVAPKLAEFNSKINQNEKLFARVKAVYNLSQKKPLPADQQRLVNLTYKDFEMRGAALNAASKKRYAAIEVELSTLYTRFRNNLLADEEGYVTFLSKDDISGLPDSYLKSAAKAAADRSKQDMYAVTNVGASVHPFLTYSDNRALREKVWRNFYSRGDNGDQNDNNAVITGILNLRQERVKLLGYDNYAQWRLQDRMARTPERAFEVMNTVWAASTKRVGEEVADMQLIADKDKVVIEPWDYPYYAEKVRKAKYDLDSDEVKQYLQLDNLRDAMFFVAGELFNFEFKPAPEGTVPVFHEDVKVWTVTNKTTGEHIGVWYLDPYTRKGKNSGAWANMYRVYSNVDGKKTTVLCSNNSNFVKPAPGEPLLINWNDANTFFHEFGHALHFLSSKVPYRSLNSGGVRDYTEFHSQLLERWLLTDQVIERYFKHYKTGEPMPKALVEKIKKAATFNQGFRTTSYLASAMMDMYYHTASSTNIDPDSFEKEKLLAMGMPKQVTMTHRSPQFYHSFAGEGYSAGYYGYLWADVLTSDAAEVFAKAPGGFYDKEVAARMVKFLFSPRNAMDPAEAYKLFRGAEPDLRYLMRDRGF